MITTEQVREAWLSTGGGPADFQAWLESLSPRMFDCPNCEGSGSVSFGLIIGAKPCPICLGEPRMTRQDYLSALGVFLLESNDDPA